MADVFARLGTIVGVDAGDVLFREGDLTTSAYYVCSGAVRLSICTANWHELVVATLGRGAVFGEMSAIDHLPRSATATATEASELIVVGSDRLDAEITHDPAFAAHLLQMLSAEVRRADHQLAVQSGQPTICRVATQLVEAFEELDPSDPPVISTTQAELAALVGSTRESTARCLARLRECGCIRTRRGMIEIVDLDQLLAHTQP